MSRPRKKKTKIEKLSESDLWVHLLGNEVVTQKNYAISNSYTIDDKITHPKFGVGFVTKILEKKRCEVLFEDKKRVLVQNH